MQTVKPPAPALPLPRSLVLLGCGAQAAIATLQQAAAPALAATLGLRLAPALAPNPASSESLPALALAGLQPPQEAALVPLLLDAGLALASGGHWAEALGAWRQPCLLLLSQPQIDTGLPAAATALLSQWQVPLLGLVQVGGTWSPEARRLDGLPWLGWLPTAGQINDSAMPDPAALPLTLQRRWAQLAASS